MPTGLALRSAIRRAAEPRRRAGARLFGLDRAVARRRRRRQRVDQLTRRFGHGIDGAVEGLLVGLRRAVEAAQLAHELQRRGTNLLVRRRRLEVVEVANVAAHEMSPGGTGGRRCWHATGKGIKPGSIIHFQPWRGPVLTVTRDMILPTTVTGSYPRPLWFDRSLEGRS